MKKNGKSTVIINNYENIVNNIFEKYEKQNLIRAFGQNYKEYFNKLIRLQSLGSIKYAEEIIDKYKKRKKKMDEFDNKINLILDEYFDMKSNLDIRTKFHTLEVDRIIKELKFNNDCIYDHKLYMTIRMAAICHDLGKTTKAISKYNNKSMKHAEISKIITEKLLDKHKINLDSKNVLLKSIEDHSNKTDLYNKHYTSKILIALIEADVLSKVSRNGKNIALYKYENLEPDVKSKGISFKEYYTKYVNDKVIKYKDIIKTDKGKELYNQYIKDYNDYINSYTIY